VTGPLRVSRETPERLALARPRALPGRQMLTASVYEAIKEQIMDLELAPGTRVNMDQLARDLEVSTTPVRESLARLESEGLVTRRSLQGYTVTAQPDPVDLHELFTLRLLLEPEAARHAAREPTAELGALLRSTVDDMASLPSAVPEEQYRRHRSFVEADIAFHDAIADASGNRLLRRTLAGLHTHVLLYRLYFEAGVAPERTSTAEEHRSIVEAILDRSPEVAASAMRVHVEHSHERVLGGTSALRPT